MSPAASNSARPNAVAQVREFNRFYTKQIGLLQEGLLESAYSLTQLRIMYELLHGNATTASALAGLLGIDRGYLSRILKRFGSLGLIERTRSPLDGREFLLNLTRKGRKVYGPLNARASAEIAQLLEGLSEQDIRRLVEAMDTIRSLLAKSGHRRRP